MNVSMYANKITTEVAQLTSNKVICRWQHIKTNALSRMHTSGTALWSLQCRYWQAADACVQV